MIHPATEVVLTYLLQRVMYRVTLLTEIAPGFVRDDMAEADRFIGAWQDSALALLRVSEEIARESALQCADQGVWSRMNEQVEVLRVALNGLAQHKSRSKDQLEQDCHAMLTAFEGILGNFSTIGQELGSLRSWLDTQSEQFKIEHRRSSLRMLPMALDPGASE